METWRLHGNNRTLTAGDEITTGDPGQLREFYFAVLACGSRE